MSLSSFSSNLYPPVLAYIRNFCLDQLLVWWLPSDFLCTSFILHILIGILYKELFVLLYSFYSSSYFSQWIIICYYLFSMIKLALIWPLETPSFWLLCPFAMLPNHYSSISLLYGQQDDPGSSCAFPVSDVSLRSPSTFWCSQNRI